MVRKRHPPYHKDDRGPPLGKTFWITSAVLLVCLLPLSGAAAGGPGWQGVLDLQYWGCWTRDLFGSRTATGHWNLCLILFVLLSIKEKDTPLLCMSCTNAWLHALTCTSRLAANAGTHSSTDAAQQELQQAYHQATHLIHQASEAVSNMGLSADAEEGFRKALSAFQASENYLRDWGISLLGSDEQHSSQHTHHQQHQHLSEHTYHRHKGVSALHNVVHQLQHLLPGEHSGSKGASTAAAGFGCAPGNSNNPAEEIQQSLQCLQHLIAGLEAAGEGGPGTHSTTATEQHQSAGDAIKHAWRKLTGKSYEVTASAAESAQHTIQDAQGKAQGVADSAKHAAHSAAAQAGDAADSARHTAANKAGKAADTIADTAKQAAHAASKLPTAAKDAVGEGADQAVYTAGFLTEVANLAAKGVKDRVLHPVLKAGEGAADAAKRAADTVFQAGAAARHDASDAAHAVEGAAKDAAHSAQHASRSAAHKVQDTMRSAKHASFQGLHDAAETADDTAHAADHAWTGVQHALHDRLSHVRKILTAVGKLPSLRAGSILSGLHQHHRAADSADSIGAASGSTEDLRKVRAQHIMALHEELESLKVGVEH